MTQTAGEQPVTSPVQLENRIMAATAEFIRALRRLAETGDAGTITFHVSAQLGSIKREERSVKDIDA